MSRRYVRLHMLAMSQKSRTRAGIRPNHIRGACEETERRLRIRFFNIETFDCGLNVETRLGR